MESLALIIGCGDVGLRVAQRLRERGIKVTGQVRSASSAEALRAVGIEPLIADLDAPSSAPHTAAPLVFWFAPPPPGGDTDPRLRAWLGAQRPCRLIYISTSGVYGDCQNRWIDEDEPRLPQTPRGRRRLDAENALCECADIEPVILRVPGIYGPGRLPIERLKKNLPVITADECPTTNRIHADDLADAAIAAADRGRAGAAYNIADGSPSTMTDYFTRCARLLGMPDPPRVSLAEARRTFTPAMLSFLEESKRLLTGRMRTELEFTPRHPDLASGLPSCLPQA